MSGLPELDINLLDVASAGREMFYLPGVGD